MMTKEIMSRHQVLRLAGIGALVLVGLFWLGLEVRAQAEVLEIRMLRNYQIGRYYFDPIALHVEPGQTVRWIAVREGFSVTAYHPDNDNHELRIPEKAKPFDSGILSVSARPLSGRSRSRVPMTFLAVVTKGSA